MDVIQKNLSFSFFLFSFNKKSILTPFQDKFLFLEVIFLI
ncbi:hypothetical protein SK110_0637 [Lactococcus cremoris]|nr:hypothetical protein SK110_0637 [Lactococcus cremoris]